MLVTVLIMFNNDTVAIAAVLVDFSKTVVAIKASTFLPLVEHEELILGIGTCVAYRSRSLSAFNWQRHTPI